MNTDDLDKIFESLTSAYHRKTQIALTKANAEIATIQREDVAYYDGAWDAIKRIKEFMCEEES